jgi:ribosomal protein S28E/S33
MGIWGHDKTGACTTIIGRAGVAGLSHQLRVKEVFECAGQKGEDCSGLLIGNLGPPAACVTRV